MKKDLIGFFRYELDGTEQTEKYPPSFRLTFDTIPSKKINGNDQEMISRQLDQTLKKAQCLFKEEAEYRQTIEEYGKNSHFVFSWNQFLSLPTKH